MEREQLEQINNQEINTYNATTYNPNQTIFENQTINNTEQPSPLQVPVENKVPEENIITEPIIEENKEIITEKLETITEINVEPKKKKKFKLFKKKNKDKSEEDTIKPLVTSRLLFISIIDKIYLTTIILILIILTYNNFKGNISSLSYHFFDKLKSEINIIIILIICYAILNWVYKCITKTVLILTQNEVYREWQVPFIKLETSIPLNKITGVTSYKFLWIFRLIIIHQYGKLPLIFPTWNNQEFKDKLNELITTDDKKIENKYKKNSLVSNKKYYIYFTILLTIIILILGIIRFISYSNSPEKDMIGTYTYKYLPSYSYYSKEYFIILNEDGTCDFNIYTDIENLESCNWEYNKKNKELILNYEYYSDYYYSWYPYEGTSSFKYDMDNKTIIFNDNTYEDWIFTREDRNLIKY